MIKAPYSTRRIKSLSAIGLYTIASQWPFALMVGVAGAIASSPPVQAQTTYTEPSTTEERLQDAQRNLFAPDGSPIPLRVELEVPPEGASTWTDPEFDTYRLGPGDSVFFNIQRFPELNFQGTLDQDGNVIVPLAGLVNLNGLTVAQAAGVVQTTLNRFVINPEVESVLTAQRPVQITIAGEIVRPGLYPLGEPKLAVALATAGGTTRLADLRAIRIRRQRVDGSIIERNVDLYSSLQTSNSIPDVRLADGDTIIVSSFNSPPGDDYDRYLVARTTIAQPQIVIRVLNYATGGGRGGGGGRFGGIQLPNGSTFVDAMLAIAPDPGQADLGDVALIRFDPNTGRPVTQEFHARRAFLGDPSQNPPLENNDVIVVGRNLIARISYALNIFTQPFRDVLGFLLFFDSLAGSASDLFGPNGDNGDDEDEDN